MLSIEVTPNQFGDVTLVTVGRMIGLPPDPSVFSAGLKLVRCETGDEGCEAAERALRSGSGVVVIAESAADIPRLRAVGADKVFAVPEDSTKWVTLIAASIAAAYRSAVERTERVRALAQAVIAHRATPGQICGEIAAEILAGPSRRAARALQAFERGDSPSIEAVAELNEHLSILQRMHDLVPRTEPGTRIDLSRCVRELVDILSATLRGQASFRYGILDQAGVALAPWQVAAAGTSMVLALLGEAPLEDPDPEKHGPSTARHHKRKAALDIEVSIRSAHETVFLELSSERVDPGTLPYGDFDPRTLIMPADLAAHHLAVALGCCMDHDVDLTVDSFIDRPGVILILGAPLLPLLPADS